MTGLPCKEAFFLQILICGDFTQIRSGMFYDQGPRIIMQWKCVGNCLNGCRWVGFAQAFVVLSRPCKCAFDVGARCPWFMAEEEVFCRT